MKKQRKGWIEKAVFSAVALVLSGLCHAQECRPPADGKWSAWLDAQEARGGHALACHVNVKENGLIRRIENSDEAQAGCRLPAESDRASAWSDKGKLIDALRQMTPAMWRQVAGGGTVNGESKYPVGMVVKAGQTKNKQLSCQNKSYTCQGAYRYVMVFRQKPDGTCHLLTAYPR